MRNNDLTYVKIYQYVQGEAPIYRLHIVPIETPEFPNGLLLSAVFKSREDAETEARKVDAYMGMIATTMQRPNAERL